MYQEQQPEDASKKSVSFATTASMRLALHINEYTDEEFQACYFSRQDYVSFKKDVKRTARAMESTAKTVMRESDHFCARGVECHTKESLRLRSKIRRAAQIAVLKEQVNQFDQPELDWDKIERACAPMSRASAVAACTIGLSDALVVKEIYNQEGKRTPPQHRFGALFSLSNAKRERKGPQQAKAVAA